MSRVIVLFLFCFIVACQSNTSNKEEVTDTATPKKIKATVKEAVDTIATPKFSTDYIMGKFDPAKHEDFIKIDVKYADREGLYLRKDAYEAFKRMHKAAEKEGIKLIIRSATRNFTAQKGIWEAKWTGKRILSDGKNARTDFPVAKDRALKILEWSSMPGTSRHHWGTDIDLNAFNNKYFSTGKGKVLYDWLLANASTYHFCQPYTAKGAERPDGYNEEKWHWSFTSVSKVLTQEAKEQLRNNDIQGFEGAETASEINVVQKYILGINSMCID